MRQRCKPLLGTYVDISFGAGVPEGEWLDLSDEAFTEIERIQGLLSFHDPNSELSALNCWALAGSEGTFQVSKEMREVLQLALELHRRSDGFYDVCVAPALVADNQLPNHLVQVKNAVGGSADLSLTEAGVWVRRPLCIDLGGIAKGYAVDCALSKLPDRGDAVVNAGGDLRMTAWEGCEVELRFGRRGRGKRSYPMLAPAVASSADCFRERRHGDKGFWQGVLAWPRRSSNSGIIDPSSGRGRRRNQTVTVFASSAMLADALTKVVWLMPAGQARELVQHYDAQALLMNNRGRVTEV